MSIAKIVAPVTGAKRDTQVLATAFAVARPFGAHVVALFVKPDPRLALPYGGTPISPQVVQDIIDAAEEMNRKAAKAARGALADAARNAMVEIISPKEPKAPASCSFQETEGFFPVCVVQGSHLSDLIVFGPVTPADADIAEAFSETLKRTVRPVLLAPNVPQSFPGKVMVAWDGSDTAARALVNAVPVLEKAKEVILLSCTETKLSKGDVREAQQYLALHGISCTEQKVDANKRSVGEALLAAVSEAKADLLIMGGYGHSQLGETIFGGVTQYVRMHANVPVLMVH